MSHVEITGTQKNIKLARFSSWLVGGEAELFAEPHDLELLKEIYLQSVQKKIPLTVLGGGTNVLISDQGIKGLVLSVRKLSGLSEFEIDKNLSFWALAGTTKSEILKFFLKNKSSAALFLAGLPGQVAGGVVMNAGVSEKLVPREFCEIIESIEILRPNGKLEIINTKNLKWDYRHCEGWRPGIITRVKISYPNTPDPNILNEVKKLNQSRLQKQPLEWPSCGSVFRNPPGLSAGKLIEDAGLKGREIGGAQISTKHGNFIINKGTAKASDIKALMDICVQSVKEKFKIELKSEVVWLE